MIKKYITPINITFFIWNLILLGIAQFFPDYTRYSIYLSIIILTPLVVVNLIKKRKEDKIEGTENFKYSIYSILIATAIMGVLFFLIYSGYPSSY